MFEILGKLWFGEPWRKPMEAPSMMRDGRCFGGAEHSDPQHILLACPLTTKVAQHTDVERNNSSRS